MEQRYNYNDLLLFQQPDGLKMLYDKYADKLLGYIFTIVNDRHVAEDCLVKTFTTISVSKNNLDLTIYNNTWDCITTLAQAEIKQIYNAADECKSVSDNTSYIKSHKYLNRMNSVQQKVFCGVYYHRKPLVELAKELALTEGDLRIILRQACMIIRSVRDEN